MFNTSINWYNNYKSLNNKYYLLIKVRMKSTSIFLTLGYLYLFDYFFEAMLLHSYKNERIIKINQGFDFRLTK
jgi:hypothetical protein